MIARALSADDLVLVDPLIRDYPFKAYRNYRVLLENGHTILAYAAGKMSKFKIRVLEGDRVSVVLSPYDLTRGRVIYRHK